MLTQTHVQQIHTAYQQGHSIRAVAKLTQFSRCTVRKYLRGATPKPKLGKQKQFLEDHADGIRDLFLECQGHCVPLQRKLKTEFNVDVHLRTLQRFCKDFRVSLKKSLEQRPYETAPGYQMQIDFGEKDVVIDGETCRVHFIVCVLSYSRRIFVKAYPAENQAAWFDGIESAFVFFGGVPKSVLSDNARCLVIEHRRNASAKLTQGYSFIADYWRFKPVASTPNYPQCKGKVERAVRYVKENALVGKTFESFQDLNQWFEEWSLSEADYRVFDDFAEGLKTPKERFLVEKSALAPVDRPRAFNVREEERKVDSMGLIRIENKRYRVPDSVKHMSVQTLITDTAITVLHGGKTVIELDKVDSVYQIKEQDGPAPDPLPALVAVDSKWTNGELDRKLTDYEGMIQCMERVRNESRNG